MFILWNEDLIDTNIKININLYQHIQKMIVP